MVVSLHYVLLGPNQITHCVNTNVNTKLSKNSKDFPPVAKESPPKTTTSGCRFHRFHNSDFIRGVISIFSAPITIYRFS